MVTLPDNDNPYVTPVSTMASDVGLPPRASMVGWCAITGAIAGIVFQITLQLNVVESSSRTINGLVQHVYFLPPRELIRMIFWGIVSASIFATLGSIAGALLDTLYSSHAERLSEQSEPPNSPVGSEFEP